MSRSSLAGRCWGGDYSCKPINICRTCNTFNAFGGFCSEIDIYPNATVAEYGTIAGERAMMAEIYKRGPIACGVDATPLDDYDGGMYGCVGSPGGEVRVLLWRACFRVRICYSGPLFTSLDSSESRRQAWR